MMAKGLNLVYGKRLPNKFFSKYPEVYDQHMSLKEFLP